MAPIHVYVWFPTAVYPKPLPGALPSASCTRLVPNDVLPEQYELLVPPPTHPSIHPMAFYRAIHALVWLPKTLYVSILHCLPPPLTPLCSCRTPINGHVWLPTIFCTNMRHCLPLSPTNASYLAPFHVNISFPTTVPHSRCSVSNLASVYAIIWFPNALCKNITRCLPPKHASIKPYFDF